MEINKEKFDYLSIVAKQPKSTKVVLARYFGTPLSKLPINGLVAFFKTLPANVCTAWSTEAASKFFVASLYCKTHKNDSYEPGSKLPEIAMKDIYNKEKSSKDESSEQLRIISLINTDFAINGKLEIKLKNIINANLSAFENVDLNKMQADLQYWNSKDFRSSRNRWARTIVAYSEYID